MSGLSLPFLTLHGQNALTASPFVLCFVPLLFLTGAIVPLLLTALLAAAFNIVLQCCVNRLAPVSAREAVLVTGAATGLGEATALHLVRLGYTVFAAVRRSEDGEQLRGQLAGPESRRLLPVVMDLLEQQSVDSCVAAVQQRVDSGQLIFRALINNVGPMTALGALETISAEQWQHSLSLNVVGTVRVTKAFLPLLRATAARGRGERARLVFTSSLSALMTVPFLAVHSANKSALEAVASAFRMELRAFGIAVSTVTPGSMDNTQRKHALAQQIPSMEQLTTGELQHRIDRSVLAQYDRQLRGMFSSMLSMKGERVERAAVAHEYCIRAWMPEARYFCSWDGTMAAAAIMRLPEMLRDRMLLHMTEAQNGGARTAATTTTTK